MTAPTARHFAFVGTGAGAAGLINALIAADMPVTVFEVDKGTAERVAHMLSGDAEVAVDVLGTGQDVSADVVVVAPEVVHRAGAAPLVALLGDPTQLDGTDAARTVALDITAFPLVELCSGSEPARMRAVDFLTALNATIITCPTPGPFPGTALQDTLYAMADRLMLHGTTPWDLDAALAGAGFASGPLEAQDRTGLDLAYARRRHGDAAPLLVSDRMVRAGRLGRAVGVGWYRYPGGGGAVVDPLMEDMIVEEARFAGIVRQELSADEISAAVEMGLINACARLRSCDVADADLDVLLHCKLGLCRPGLMARADTIGADTVVERLEGLTRKFGTPWAPTQALRQLASDKRGFTAD